MIRSRSLSLSKVASASPLWTTSAVGNFTPSRETCAHLSSRMLLLRRGISGGYCSSWHNAASYSAGQVMSAPLQNHCFNGSMDSKEHHLGADLLEEFLNEKQTTMSTISWGTRHECCVSSGWSRGKPLAPPSFRVKEFSLVA